MHARWLVMLAALAACTPGSPPSTSTQPAPPALVEPAREHDGTVRVRYDATCRYDGPALVLRTRSNLVPVELVNDGAENVLFVVLAIGDRDREGELAALVADGSVLAARPAWAEVVEVRVVAPGKEMRALPDVSPGPHALLCQPGASGGPSAAWQLVDVVDFVTGG